MYGWCLSLVFKETVKTPTNLKTSPDEPYHVIGGFEFALDGMLNVQPSGVKYRKPTVTLWKCNVPHPFVGKTRYALKMASYQVSCLDSVAQNRYRDKLSLLDMNEDEDPYQSMNFIDDMMLWPPVCYGDIFCYFTDQPGV